MEADFFYLKGFLSQLAGIDCLPYKWSKSSLISHGYYAFKGEYLYQQIQNTE